LNGLRHDLSKILGDSNVYCKYNWIYTMSLKISIRNIKKRNLYTIKDAAEAVGVCTKTIRRMITNGLPVLEMNSNPLYILGMDLLDHIKMKNAKHKVVVKADEFFCFTCKIAVKSIPKDFQIIFTRKRLGKNNFQAILNGRCEICNREVFKFSTEERIVNLVKRGVFNQKHITVLIVTSNSS